MARNNKAESHTDVAKLVQSLIDEAYTTDSEGKVTRNLNLPISNADLLRLVQLHRETIKERHVDIVEYRWVDPTPKS
jgi:hypothetical protein